MPNIKRFMPLYRLFIVLMAAVYTLLSWSAIQASESGDLNNVPIEVAASVEKSDVTIGDKINVIIQAKSPVGVNVTIPDPGDRIGEFFVKDAGETKEAVGGKEGDRIVERRYILRSYKTGLQIIPPIKIKYHAEGYGEGEVATNELEINIKGMIKEGEEITDIRDIAPPLGVDTNYVRLLQWIFAGVAAIALFMLAYRILKKQKGGKRVQTRVAAKKLPHETAYELLEILLKEDLVGKGLVKEYYYRITNILRHYIEDRFGLSAPERTTEEFLVEMAYTNKLNTAHKKYIQEFLEKCDCVKYAKYGPSLLESQETYHLARRLVDETKSEGEEKKEEAVIVDAK